MRAKNNGFNFLRGTAINLKEKGWGVWGGVQISWAAPDSAAGPRPARCQGWALPRPQNRCWGEAERGRPAVARLAPGLISWWRWKCRCRASAGTRGAHRGSPPSGWVRGSRVPPRARCAAPSPSPLLDPLGTGAFPRPCCVPPPGLCPHAGRGGQGGEANSCFVSEGMGEAEMAASRLRAGLRRLGCLIKKWPRWPPPGTAGAFLRLLLPQRLGALLSTAHSTQGC